VKKKILSLVVIGLAISGHASAQCKSGDLVKLAEPDKTIWITAKDRNRCGIAI
jgi:hypothetical protein